MEPRDMTGDIMKEIMTLCLATEERASQIYTLFSESSKNPELKRFWSEMTGEEYSHIAYWVRLLELNEQGMIPVVFERPYEVKSKLESILPRVDELLGRSGGGADVNTQFLVAYRMEFYMLYSAYRYMFHFLKNIFDEKTPEDEYAEHLRKFSDALRKYGSENPEMELLGETLERLWVENENLVKQATVDSLTGVLNRNGFYQSVIPLAYLAKRNKEVVSVLIVDVDDFKQINDTCGHLQGDKALRSVAAAIKASIRRSDIVSRFGGDEFIIFLPSVQHGTAATVAEKIRSKIQETEHGECAITVSVGVHEAMLMDNAEAEIEAFTKKADDALYKAKDAGKNAVATSANL